MGLRAWLPAGLLVLVLALAGAAPARAAAVGSSLGGLDQPETIATGVNHTCAIKTDGTPVCWGDNTYGQTTVPDGTGTVTQITAGYYHTCALKTDGTPVCWGDNTYGQSEVPDGTGTVTQITGGYYHTCALKTDGTPVCWGADEDGETDVPGDIGTVKQITAGGSHTCAITSNGTPVCWGLDDSGEIDVPDDIGAVTQIFAGNFHTCAITASGTPACWGENAYGEAGVPGDVGTVTQITAGAYHTCAVKTDGFIRCWGRGDDGELARPATLSNASPPPAGSGADSFATQATAARPPAIYTVSAGSLPAGLSLDPSSGTITGTATTAGSSTFTVIASNDVTAPVSAGYTITADPTAPTTTDDVDANFHPGPVTVTLTATDTGGSGVDKTYYTIGASPAAPTTASTVYDAANKPTLDDGEKIRYFSVDLAGNAEADHTSNAAKVNGVAPETSIDAKPDAMTHDARPSFSFSSPASGATFECSLDGATFAVCVSPLRPEAALADGKHAFAVRAVNNAGVVDASPATADFTVDTNAPDAPTAGTAPPASSSATTATFTFTGEAGARFTCQLDNAAPAPCTSPVTVKGLAAGAHVFKVTQTDAAGNAGAPLVVRFTVTTPATATATPTPAPAVRVPVLSFSLTGKNRQLILNKRYVAAVIGCGPVTCKAKIAGVAKAGKRIVTRLNAVRVNLRADQQRRVHIRTTKRQRAKIRALVGRNGTRTRLVFHITATTPDGKTTTKRFVIKLRRLH